MSTKKIKIMISYRQYASVSGVRSTRKPINETQHYIMDVSDGNLSIWVAVLINKSLFLFVNYG